MKRCHLFMQPLDETFRHNHGTDVPELPADVGALFAAAPEARSAIRRSHQQADYYRAYLIEVVLPSDVVVLCIGRRHENRSRVADHLTRGTSLKDTFLVELDIMRNDLLAFALATHPGQVLFSERVDEWDFEKFLVTLSSSSSVAAFRDIDEFVIVSERVDKRAELLTLRLRESGFNVVITGEVVFG